MSIARKITIASLGGLGIVLLGLFMYVYYSAEEDSLVELTGPSTQGTESSGELAAGTEGDGEAATAPPASLPEPVESALRVYVAGAVGQPGVYEVGQGDRLVDAVEAAGGAAEDADLEAVNLAARVEDEGYYYIPVKLSPQETEPGLATVTEGEKDNRFPPLAIDFAKEETDPPVEEAQTPSDESGGLIDLNRATQSELETLPGIGPARSKAIIAFRDQNGPFTAVEEITAVSGIGQGILDNLRGLITVGENP